jgi:tetratricopeptide (TPR) repeat protein
VSAPFRVVSVLLAAVAAGARAQDTAVTAAEALAAKATADVVAAYHARADALAAQKQFGRALQLRRELIQEWAPGDARALKALGFVDVGSIWRRDANIVVFDRDQKGDAKVLKKLDSEWSRTQKDLIKGVEQAAQALTAAGAADRALVFWRRLLRLKPGDARATAALKLPTFDGIAGTPDELRLVRRGRAITQAIAFLKQWEPRIAPIQREHPVLKKAGLACTCVQSDHFTVFGTMPPDKLLLAARFAERALLLSRALFGTAGGAVFEPKLMRSIVCCGDKGSYHRVLDACAEQFDKDRLAFLKEYVELAFTR